MTKARFFRQICLTLLIIAITILVANNVYAANGGGIVEKVKGLDKYFITFIANVRKPLVSMVAVFCWIAGIIMMICAILRVSKPGFINGNKGTPAGTVTMFVVAAMLISLPTAVNTIERTVFDSDQVSMSGQQNWESGDLAYSTLDDDADKERILNGINAAFQYVRILGLIAFVRGLFILKTAIDGGQGSMLMGTIHIIAGVMAMNIAPVARIFFATVGVES